MIDFAKRCPQIATLVALGIEAGPEMIAVASVEILALGWDAPESLLRLLKNAIDSRDASIAATTNARPRGANDVRHGYCSLCPKNGGGMRFCETCGEAFAADVALGRRICAIIDAEVASIGATFRLERVAREAAARGYDGAEDHNEGTDDEARA